MQRIGKIVGIVALGLPALFLALAVISPLSGPRPSKSPPAMTRLLLSSVAAACSQYWADYGEPPASLAVLTNNPKGIAFMHWGKESTNDGWGNPIRFKPYDASLRYGSVTSYGRDGRPGGKGRDADTEVRFGEKRR